MLVDFVSKHALILIAEEFDQVNDVEFDSERCGCVLRRTHGLPCACQLARYDMGVIPLNEVHVMWTRRVFQIYLNVIHHLSFQFNKNGMSFYPASNRLIFVTK